MARVLLIEDMKGVRESLDMILSMAGHTVDPATNGQAGIQKIKTGSYDLIITDILMPEMDGTEVILHAKSQKPNIPILAISAGGKGVSAESALAVASEKADAVLEKPFSKDDFLTAVNQLTG